MSFDIYFYLASSGHMGKEYIKHYKIYVQKPGYFDKINFKILKFFNTPDNSGTY